jgi:hypothetical protein
MGLPAMHQFGYGSRAGILDDFGTCLKMLEYDGKS